MKVPPICFRIAALFIYLLIGSNAPAQTATDLKLPRVIGDNMVLQRDKTVPIWGWAAPGTNVTVEFLGQKRTAIADADGRWCVYLRSLSAQAVPATMKICAGQPENIRATVPDMVPVYRNFHVSQTMVLTNILVGEVWLCSGQSNMEKPIGTNGWQTATVNAAQELATGDQFPQIRLFKVAKVKSARPARDVTAAAPWTVCSSNALDKTAFSAVGYFFGRKLYRDLHVPIGLVESSWGGTMIEPWTPASAYRPFPKLAELANVLPGETNLSGAARPAVIYNGMIAPLAPFALRGALWYQGESNVKDAAAARLYPDKMEALISSWRNLWGEGKFPFYFVQLAPFKYSGRSAVLPQMWAAQTAALRIPHTGMAVIDDTVENFGDIHPVRKVEVGERLALLALALDYHEKVACYGPMFKSATFSKKGALVKFDHVAGGLMTRDGKSPDWFELAGADGKFAPAAAVIEGGKVLVSSERVPMPKAVRLGWNETASPNLFNAAGLPALPFTTEKW